MKSYHAKVATAIVILVGLANLAVAQEAIVFAGYPISKVESTSDDVESRASRSVKPKRISRVDY